MGRKNLREIFRNKRRGWRRALATPALIAIGLAGSLALGRCGGDSYAGLENCGDGSRWVCDQGSVQFMCQNPEGGFTLHDFTDLAECELIPAEELGLAEDYPLISVSSENGDWAEDFLYDIICFNRQ